MENKVVFLISTLFLIAVVATDESNQMNGPGNLVISGTGNVANGRDNTFDGSNNQADGNSNNFKGDLNNASGNSN